MSKPQEFECEVLSNTWLTPTVFSLNFKTDKPFDFLAGQFLNVLLPPVPPENRVVRRAYSIASAPGRQEVQVCIQVVESGKATAFLRALKPGDRFKSLSPFGRFVFVNRPENHHVFIATGTGVAPYRSIFQSGTFLTNRPHSVTCLLGVRTEEEILYGSEFAQMDWLDWRPCLTRPTPQWDGFKGRVTDYLRQLSDDYPWKASEFYLCGNGAMIKEAVQILTQKGVDKKSIHQEAYFTPESQ